MTHSLSDCIGLQLHSRNMHPVPSDDIKIQKFLSYKEPTDFDLTANNQ